MIGNTAPAVRPDLSPLSSQRGGEGARVDRGANQEARSKDQAARQDIFKSDAPEQKPKLKPADTQTARPVPPANGVLALGLDQLQTLQGTPPEQTPQQAPDQKSDQRSDLQTEKQAAPGELTKEEEQVVRELSHTDQEVRRHERAHAAAGGAIAGAPSYEYQKGPDGKRYAVGGEVSIDISPVQDDPNATIEKMRQVKAAATAPAQPSGQDRSVAAAADAISQKAQADLQVQRTEEVKKTDDAQDNKAPVDKKPEAVAAASVPDTGKNDRPETSRPAATPEADRNKDNGVRIAATDTGNDGPAPAARVAPDIASSAEDPDIASSVEDIGRKPEIREDKDTDRDDAPEVNANPNADIGTGPLSNQGPQRDVRPGSFADISV